MEAKKLIKDGVLFGLGYMTGRYSIPTIPKAKREKIADDFADDIVKNKLFNNEYKTKLLIDFKKYWKKSNHQNIDDAIKGFLNK